MEIVYQRIKYKIRMTTTIKRFSGNTLTKAYQMKNVIKAFLLPHRHHRFNLMKIEKA